MKKTSLVALVVALVACLPGAALPQATMDVAQVSLEGSQEMTGEAVGLRLAKAQANDMAFSGEGATIRVRTTNATNPSVGGVGIGREPGGDDQSFARASIQAGIPGADVDLVLVPIEGAALPVVQSRTGQLVSGISSQTELREISYVDNARPVLTANVSEVLEVNTRGASHLRIEGSFALSLWAWNFTVSAAGQTAHVNTGSMREDPVRDPFVGTELAWTSHVQVAQVFVTDGWIEFSGGFGNEWTTFLPAASISGLGTIRMDDATGNLGTTKLPMAGTTVDGKGAFTLVQEFAEPTTRVALTRLVGELNLNGVPIDLGNSGPIRNDVTQVAPGGPVWPRYLGPAASIIGLMAVVALVKGPAQMARFNRLESRFESRDYLGVLTRIDPFTHKRRYQRRATFLKTVSLLSLQEYREAALFLETMNPGEAPEPATKAFLQACAAAGLGQDDVAIQHLSTCLRLDPTYKDEVKEVPVLAGYLAYFSVDATGRASQ